jgi:hypothetical protein
MSPASGAGSFSDSRSTSPACAKLGGDMLSKFESNSSLQRSMLGVRCSIFAFTRQPRLLFYLFYQAHQARYAKAPGIHFFPKLHSSFGNSEFVIPLRTHPQALVQLPTSPPSPASHLRFPLLLRWSRRAFRGPRHRQGRPHSPLGCSESGKSFPSPVAMRTV